jgi:hypothetical protein
MKIRYSTLNAEHAINLKKNLNTKFALKSLSLGFQQTMKAAPRTKEMSVR